MKMIIKMFKSYSQKLLSLERQNNLFDDRGKLLKLYQEGVIDRDKEYIGK